MLLDDDQINPTPPAPSDEPPKSDEPIHYETKKKAPEPAPVPKPQDRDWTPINVKSGTFRNKELFSGSRQSFVWHEQKDLKHILPGGENFAVRKAFAEELAKVRGQGITRTEAKKAIENIQKKFGLSDVKARKLRGKLGTYRS